MSLDANTNVSLMFLLVGGGFVVTGVRAALRWRSFRRRAVSCTGVVTGFRTKWRSGSGRGRYIHFPVLAFCTGDGTDVRTTASNGSSPTFLRDGQQVDVLYDPHDPAHAYAGRGTTARVLPVVFALGGCVPLAFGVFMLVGGG